MKVEKDLHMSTGDGANSYAANSRLPVCTPTAICSTAKKALLMTKPVLQKAIQDMCTSSISSRSTVVVADLGCSSGPNTLLVVDEVMSTLRDCTREAETTDEDDWRSMQVQFFLNDLPGNDFNLVFRSLQQLQDFDVEEEDETVALPCYVAGLPGSYYRRLFPCQSVHLFHSSYSLMWRSKVPDDLSNGTYLNEENIYIGKTTPPSVVKLFQEQFQKDFKLFLTLRCKELVGGGRMVLTFLGRKTEEMLTHGEVGSMFELLAKALQCLVQKGLVEKEKMNSFNLPYYAPSVDEVKALIEEELFDIENIRLFESNWDPLDDSDSDVVLDCASSGRNVANKSIRAVMEPLIINHFGEAILDELFMVFAAMVAKYLEIRKAKYPVIVVSLKKVRH
ncbi:hypothetical protein SEVIR_9G378400v4 [Setaria viridis]|uniref:Uncharacterized protein n=1 Tax=Setaria viridis TaxID=4556 RepID=A0A4U6T296_SETVI|nr:anthranilate O-methyltransferase 2-like isoform X1 [Setaria viridis]TKV95678.1 hypothetical protein SEVIR_9G378400v2 [Setaria viridis]TKV95679.1 hypothetical protein SEVIR_9G378400v2 [Setaria viridis]